MATIIEQILVLVVIEDCCLSFKSNYVDGAKKETLCKKHINEEEELNMA